jgi:MSHA biogenesis protein MshL
MKEQSSSRGKCLASVMFDPNGEKMASLCTHDNPTRRPLLRLRAAWLLPLCAVLAACSVTGARPVPDTALLENMQDILGAAERSHSTEYELPARQTVGELIPGLSISEDLLVPVEERFDIAANAENAGDFFNNLVAGTQYGVLVSPSVQGQISISMPGVTIDEVMNAVQEAYGYTISRTGNIYQVQEATLQSRIFTIDYLNVRRAGSSNVQVSSGGSGSSGGSTLGSGGIGGVSSGIGGIGGIGGVGGGTGGISSGVGGSGGGGGGQVSTQTETDFWTDISDTLISLIGGSGEGRSVVAQPQVGLIMVTAMPHELERVSAYIEQAQGILSREVTVQVQFLEVILNKGFQSAIDFDTFGPGGADGTDNTVVGEFTSGGDSTMQGISNPLAISTNFTDFSAVFRILESRGTTQVLSSPSLKVLNNQKAVFQDGDQEYFQTSAGSNIVSSGQSVTQSSANNLQQFFSGISMDITPQISADGSITLHVHPTITTVTEQTKPIGGQQVPLARTSVRELDSIIRAENGKIVVLGGLAYERSVDEASGIPLASDLPAIGAAFDQRRRTTVKSEFIILLRPVIANPQSEQQLIRDRRDRLNEINRDLDPFFAR